jgi:hypothetical protein
MTEVENWQHRMPHLSHTGRKKNAPFHFSRFQQEKRPGG